MTLPADFLPALRARLDALYGDRLARVVLFGSYARGEATPESDVDVLVVLHGDVAPYAEARALSEISVNLMDQYDRVLSFVVWSEAEAARDWPLMWNVREEGLAVER